MNDSLIKVDLDELEAILHYLEEVEDIRELTSKQIADRIQQRFGIECKEEEIFLLHDPQVSNVIEHDVIYD